MAKTRTTKKTMATETVIESPPMASARAKDGHALTDMLKKPFVALFSFVWDDKAGTFSAARLILIVGNVFGMILMWDVRDMLWDSFRANRDIPNLDWYFPTIAGYLIAVNTPYFSSKRAGRYSNKGRYPLIPEEDE
jgi:hypothetical protein